MRIERSPKELIGGLVAGSGMVLALSLSSANVAGAQEPQPPQPPNVPGMPEYSDTPPIDEQRPTYAELEAELSEVRIVAENALETAEEAEDLATLGGAAFAIACAGFVMAVTAKR